MARRGLRTPFLRVAKNGSTLSNRAFTAPGGVGATIDDQVSDDKLVRLFADGSTMVLQALHRVWPPIIDFCLDLAAELGHPVQANAYITPPQNQGFSNHYDVHDVFVLQIAGEKEWTIHAPVHPAPLRDQPWTDRRAAVERRAGEPPLIQTVLRPGDCLYLPRGFLHAARACGGVSSHLTLGVHTWTRYTLAERLLQHALRRRGADRRGARVAPARGLRLRSSPPAGPAISSSSGGDWSRRSSASTPKICGRTCWPQPARDSARRPSGRWSSSARFGDSTSEAPCGCVIICLPTLDGNGDTEPGAA